MWQEEIMLEFEVVSRHNSEELRKTAKKTQIQFLVYGQRF
jgi:hypothetical protein